jgi:hypothetical protein
MAQKVEVELELKYKEAVKNLDEFQKEYAKLEKEVVSANEKTAKSLKQVEKSADDGAKGIKKVGVSLKSIGAATGIIFLLQKAFEFVSTAIQENQVVMDGLNVVFKTAQIIFNEVLGVITDVYNSVASASENFDALGKVISGLLTLAFAPLKVAFYGIIAAAEGVKLAYENMFGDEDSIAKAQEDLDATNEKLKQIAIEVNKAGSDIVNNFSEAISEAGNIGTQVVDGLKEISIEAAIETAKTNQALEKSAQIAAAESRILLEQYDRQAEIQRQIRDDETKSIAERQAANDELNVILDNQEKAMVKNAEIVLAAAQAQFNLTGKTEDYVAVLDAQAEKEGVLSQVTGFRSEQQTNKNALDKEAIEIANAKLESESLLSIEQKRFNAEQIEDELLRLQRLAEIDLLEAEQETIRLQAIVDNANAGTQAKIDAQIALDEFLEISRQTNLTREQEIAEEEMRLAEQKIAMQNKVLDDLIAIGGAETKFGQAMLIAKQLLLAKELIMEMKATLFTAKNSATKSVIKAAEAGVDLASGTAKTAGAAPFPANIPLIIGYAATAVGIIAAIRSALKASKAATKGVGPPTPDITTPTPGSSSMPPAFNIVGQSDTNQLADAIGGQTQQPVQAFVVSSEVTTAQELDRNIIDGASIG